MPKYTTCTFVIIYDYILLFCNDYYVYYSMDVFLFNKNC